MFLHFVKKLGAIGTGFMTLSIVNDAFDYIAYPLTIGLMGPIKGGVLMAVAALLLNYCLVLIYNRTKQDWLGLEWLRMQEQTEATTGRGRLLRFLLRRMRWLFIAFLSWEDPFKAFVYLRGRIPIGVKFTAADWRLLFGVNLLGNLIWVVLVSGAIEVVKRVIFG